MEGPEYNRHSRARVAETAKRRVEKCNAMPDAPEHIDNGRRCTRPDRRTCCRGSARERVPTATREKRVEMCRYTRASSPEMQSSLDTRKAAPIQA